MSLFNIKDVTLHSGGKSSWIVDCEALTDEDLATLAHMASKILGSFGEVVGVPRGGLRFAEALAEYAENDSLDVLIADDVLTTGNSMEEIRKQYEASEATVQGVVMFARGDCPAWIIPLWRVDPYLWVR